MGDDMFLCGVFGRKNRKGDCECTNRNMRFDESKRKCYCKNGKGSIFCNVDVCQIGGIRMCQIYRFGYSKCTWPLDEFSPDVVGTCNCSNFSYQKGAYEVNKACSFESPPPPSDRSYGSDSSGGSGSNGYKSSLDIKKDKQAFLNISTGLAVGVPVSIILIMLIVYIIVKNCFHSDEYRIPTQQLTDIPTQSTGPNVPSYTTYSYTYNPPGQLLPDCNQPDVSSVPLLPYGMDLAPVALHTDSWQANTVAGPSVPFQSSLFHSPNKDENKVPPTPPPAYNELYK